MRYNEAIKQKTRELKLRSRGREKTELKVDIGRHGMKERIKKR